MENSELFCTQGGKILVMAFIILICWQLLKSILTEPQFDCEGSGKYV